MAESIYRGPGDYATLITGADDDELELEASDRAHEEEWPDHFNDTGCRFFPSCLNCPLPQCLYDDPSLLQQHKANERRAGEAEMARVMQEEGLSVEQAAERFQVTVRTIFRRLERVREWQGAAAYQPA